MSRTLSLCLLLFATGAAGAQKQPEPLVKKVKTSIARGVDYLVKQQRLDGSWETTQDIDNKNISSIYDGGATALTLLALLNCDGVLLDAPTLEAARKQAIQRGLGNLRKIESSRVYVRALQTMALAEAKTDLKIVKANVDWLLEARVYRDGKFIGWEYSNRAANRETDASNSQYAMLALWYARQAGVPIDRKVWEEIRDYYGRTQNENGFWVYSPFYGPADKDRPSMTMTVAGLCGLSIAGMELNGGREKWLANGRFENCGAYDNGDSLGKAQAWLSKHFTIDLKERAYYHLYGLERAGRLSGNRFFGEHDWYREGCEFLVKKQEANGAWPARGGWDRWPHINTSFALLFLSKGRTPVLISKLVHGEWRNGRNEKDTDWNNDRNDLRHLTDYLSRGDMFDKKAIAWQTYDIRRAIEAHLDKNNTLSAEEEAAIVADMRQSPILYITGHQSIMGRFQAVEIKLIKRYVESGGFIFAEACCGDADFDKGFKAWVNDNWDQPLEYLKPEHPVWTCFNEVQPGKPYQLMGLQTGCRTAIIYSPQDLSCHWESNQHDGAARPAFLLGANIVAFATGKIPPQPRLTPIEIADNDKEMKDPRRHGAFQVRQLRHGAKWPAENAMKNLLKHVHEVTGLDVMPRPEMIPFKGFESTTRSSKFFYMHGSGDFSANPKDLEPLHFTLRYGGLLFADACCGDKDFDKAFRKFAQDLFPHEKLVNVPADATGRDYLFSEALNGEELSAKNIQCRVKANDRMASMEPYLEGIKINGRWVVLYSKYDIGCALERSTSPNCVGYDPASAFKIATAAVRYNTRP